MLLSLSIILLFFVFHLRVVAIIVAKSHSVNLNTDKCVCDHDGHYRASETFVCFEVDVISLLSQC